MPRDRPGRQVIKCSLVKACDGPQGAADKMKLVLHDQVGRIEDCAIPQPLALGLGEGSEMSAPMAVSVVGGLTVSTILTLIFIPVLYTIVETRIKSRRHNTH